MRYFLLTVFLVLTACYRVPDKLEPQLDYTVQDGYIQALPPAFPPLSAVEKNTQWGAEYQIAMHFAKELDLYRAISTFKRTEILIPKDRVSRLMEVQYYTVYCYYLAKRYDDVIYIYNHSKLRQVTPGFPAYHDFLVILYESFLKTDQEEEALAILECIDERYPETAKKLEVSTAFATGHIDAISQISTDEEVLAELVTEYKAEKKLVSRAQLLNTFFPGAGYYYVGQKQTAATSFLLNALFITAAVQFFRNGHVAAGLITTSFESGWYFGGIYGAGEAAKLYNERLYEKKAFSIMGRQGLYPVLTLRYGF
ncbi:MAG: hypothetical protein SP1CHLAM54_17390 [Chlamydiia bacterium]|nr:hypothetical protein [Chlamydiia bacterium]MCH9616627.1 hypothetical protein [Chlamydiia bacterium]MCH9629358.1 hypothetical protein [Chlamydiia bacterium]